MAVYSRHSSRMFYTFAFELQVFPRIIVVLAITQDSLSALFRYR